MEPALTYLIITLVWTFFWSAIMGIIPPAICSFAIGWWMYKYGVREALKREELVKKELKDEIRAYVKNELVPDILDGVAKVIKDTINGIFSQVGKGATPEAQAAAAEYAKNNPGLAQTLLGVATRSGARWLGKQLGIPKDVTDTLAGGGLMPQGLGALIPKKMGNNNELAPVRVPGP